MIKKKVIIFSDSIITCPKLKKENKCIRLLSKKLKSYRLTHTGIIGASSRVALENIEKNVLRKKPKIVIFQFGINDSWHFKSLKGMPNVSVKVFKHNLVEMIYKCKRFNIQKILFLNYHKLLKKRKETNGKTVNHNLNNYNLAINSIARKIAKVRLIDIKNYTTKISPKLICLPEPDGVHLSNFGAKIYAEILEKNLKKI